MSNFVRKCYVCKKNIDILDNELNLNDIIFFDNHFLHLSCYNSTKNIIKKCCFCKKDIIYGIKIKDNGIFYDNHYYHNDCFDKWCNALKRITPKRKYALDHKDDFRHEYFNKMEYLLSKHSNTQKTIKELNDNARNEIEKIRIESELDSFIKLKYNFRVIPTNIWRKLNSIYKGEYKNINIPIPAEHLLDMWERKNKELTIIYQNNLKKGKVFTNESLFNYDLAILLNQYDSYLKWLEKNKKELSVNLNNKEINNSVKIARNIINNYGTNKTKDIIDDVNDIFDQ